VATVFDWQKHEMAVGGTDNEDMLCKEKEPFEKQLYKFMREKKTPIKRIPSLGFKEGQFTPRQSEQCSFLSMTFSLGTNR